jgi:hypothetical protein
MYHFEFIGHEHHRVVFGGGELGEDLGVPGVVVAR